MKKNIFTFIGVIFIIQMFLAGMLNSADAFSIELTVKERGNVDRVNEPVTYGVPFSEPMNVLLTSGLKVVQSDGSTVPAQFRALSRYDGDRDDITKPIRVVLVDFQTDIIAFATDKYYLQDGVGGIAGGANIATEDATHVIITTGALIAKISKTSFNLFDEVLIAKDGDGIVDDQIVSSNLADGIVIDYNGTDYTSYNYALTPTDVTIEENGPLRAVVKATGYFEDGGNNRAIPPLGDKGLTFTVRFTAYKDASYVKVDITLENENRGWTTSDVASEGVHNIFINSVNVKTTLDLQATKTVAFDGGYTDTSAGSNYVLSQEHQENGTPESGNFVYTITKGGVDEAGFPTVDRYDSYADLNDGTQGLMVANRWFWQNWPKEINMNNNVLNYYLWPDVASDHRILGGIYKTHEMIYYFHDTDATFTDELATLKKRLTAKASGLWFAQSDFFGPMVPAGVTSAYTFQEGELLQAALNKYDNTIRAKYDASYSNAGAKETFFDLREDRPIANANGPLNWYGWLWFGDTPRGAGTWGYSAQHYAWDYISLANSLRFDDEDMFDIGEEFISHKADIIIIHDPDGAGLPSQELIYHGAHRYEQDALMSFNDGYSASRQSMVKRASHFWNKGLILQYFLTGNERYYDVAEQTGFHLVYSFITGEGCNIQDCGESASRNQARGVYSLIDVYKMTGDSQYLDAAYNIFVNGLLTREGPMGGSPKEGYLDQEDSGITHAYCGGLVCDNRPHHDVIAAEALVNLYYTLKGVSRDADAGEVKAFLERQADWAKNTLYKHWVAADGGTYRNGNTEYFNYAVKHEFNKTFEWNTPNSDVDYAMRYADTFAFLYKEDGDISWLNLARSVFKDYHFYSTYGNWYNVVTTPAITGKGFASPPSNGYLKIGPSHTKPLFYLRTEWTMTVPPSPPENVAVQ